MSKSALNETFFAECPSPVKVEPPQPTTKVIIWLHGLGADGHDFAALVPQLVEYNAEAFAQTRFIFPHAPEQAVTINGGMRMRAWYDIRSMTIDENVDVHGIQHACKAIEMLIAEQVAAGINAQNILLAGFSQGGLIALHSALHSHYLIAGVLALSTYYPHELLSNTPNANLQASESVAQLNVFMGHGLMDPVIPIAIAEQSKTHLTAGSSRIGTLAWHSYAMEHSVCSEEIADLGKWLRTYFL